jgi:hypothetical protein
MEPLIFPKTSAPLGRSERVARANPRGGSGQGSPFSNQRRKQKENASGSQSASEENLGFSGKRLEADEVDSPGRPLSLSEKRGGILDGRKLIDVRV